MGLTSIKDVQLNVFEITNSQFRNIGEVNQFTSLEWGKAYQEYGEFKLEAPITSENLALIKEGYVLWLGEEDAMLIQIVKQDSNSDGERTIEAEGRSLTCLLETRCLWNSVNYENQHASTIMYDIVNKSCINPTETKRKIPYLVADQDKQIGGQISYQKTGESVYEALCEIAETSGLGFRITIDVHTNQLTFEVYEGTDRSVDQSSVKFVEFSTEVDDILESSFYHNAQDYRNVAWVWGEEMDPDDENYQPQIKHETGDTTSTGFDRKELFVDADDIERVVEEDDQEVVLSETVYKEQLAQRGQEELGENPLSESFEVQLRNFGYVQNILDEDYFIGDTVTITDTIMGVRVNARVTGYTYNITNDFTIDMTFGYGYPTLLKAVRRTIKRMRR